VLKNNRKENLNLYACLLRKYYIGEEDYMYITLSKIDKTEINNSWNYALRKIRHVNCESARKTYLEKYPDVKSNGADPWTHYTMYGKNEGRIWPQCSEEKINSGNGQIEYSSGKVEDGSYENGKFIGTATQSNQTTITNNVKKEAPNNSTKSSTEKTSVNSNSEKPTQPKTPSDPGFEKLAIGTRWSKGQDALLEKTATNTYKFIWRDSYGVVNKITLRYKTKEIEEGWGRYYVTI